MGLVPGLGGRLGGREASPVPFPLAGLATPVLAPTVALLSSATVAPDATPGKLPPMNLTPLE